MKIKRFLAALWVSALFILLLGGLLMGKGVSALKQAGFHIHPVYTQE